MELPFSFATYFTHHLLIHQLVNGEISDRLNKNLNIASLQSPLLAKHDANRAYNQSVVEYILQHQVQPLEKLLVGETHLKPGTIFYVETSMMFKGASKAWEAVTYKNEKPSYFGFQFSFDSNRKLLFSGELNAEHLYSTSAVHMLSRRQTKFLFGYIQYIDGDNIKIRTVLIGDRVLSDNAIFPYQPPQTWLNINDIDEFSEIKSISLKDPSLNIEINKSIPEKEIKRYIAEIIGETDVEKDWGGEQSDLYTTQLHVRGVRLRAAFVLKGPAKFHKMELRDLGKNGDQIARLFDEPADIFILQHCHHISSAVIKTMDAFANQINRPRKYCIINGIDTLRLLKAYNKLPAIR